MSSPSKFQPYAPTTASSKTRIATASPWKMEGRPRGGGGGGARTAMDYSLAALKLFASQLTGSTTAPSSEGSSPAQMLFGIRFKRAWIQVPMPDPSSLPCPFLSFVRSPPDGSLRQAGRGSARGLQHRRRQIVRGWRLLRHRAHAPTRGCQGPALAPRFSESLSFFLAFSVSQIWRCICWLTLLVLQHCSCSSFAAVA